MDRCINRVKRMGRDELDLGLWVLWRSSEGLERGVGRKGKWGGLVGWNKSLQSWTALSHRYGDNIRVRVMALRFSISNCWNKLLHHHSHISYASLKHPPSKHHVKLALARCSSAVKMEMSARSL